ncbi:MAG: hypothetical protein KDB01_17095 [Planctomycetaceae bacterium]|nr:hypothetical protein [Planctomycetaceae bacterium]
MALFHINLAPSNRQLFQFGCICLVAAPLMAWLWTRNTEAVIWAGAGGAVLFGIGCVSPGSLRPVFVGMMIVTQPIGLVAGELAMLLIYFGLFVPMAIMLRIMGRDSLNRRFQTNEQTFWRARKQPKNVRTYYHQF